MDYSEENYKKVLGILRNKDKNKYLKFEGFDTDNLSKNEDRMIFWLGKIKQCNDNEKAALKDENADLKHLEDLKKNRNRFFGNFIELAEKEFDVTL